MAADPNRQVHIFWDNSNIFIGAKASYGKKFGIKNHSNARIEFGNLLSLAAAGRKVAKAFCVGSVPPELEKVWMTLESKTGIRPELYERGRDSGTEQALDQALQVHMLRSMADEVHPQIAVLLTGDGAGYADGVGFHADLERMHKKGWGIEVLSWELCCATKLKTWAAASGVFIPLDNFAQSIIFEQGLTAARPLNLKRRPLVK